MISCRIIDEFPDSKSVDKMKSRLHFHSPVGLAEDIVPDL